MYAATCVSWIARTENWLHESPSPLATAFARTCLRRRERRRDRRGHPWRGKARDSAFAAADDAAHGFVESAGAVRGGAVDAVRRGLADRGRARRALLSQERQSSGDCRDSTRGPYDPGTRGTPWNTGA